MKPYLYFDGLKQLTKEINGNEVVHIGIRPYGFHAGNVIALVDWNKTIINLSEKVWIHSCRQRRRIGEDIFPSLFVISNIDVLNYVVCARTGTGMSGDFILQKITGVNQ